MLALNRNRFHIKGKFYILNCIKLKGKRVKAKKINFWRVSTRLG